MNVLVVQPPTPEQFMHRQADLVARAYRVRIEVTITRPAGDVTTFMVDRLEEFPPLVTKSQFAKL